MSTKDHVWTRVQEELDARGRGLKWLADALGTSVQRVQNWKARGLPPGVHVEVATALGRSLDWMAGIAPVERQPMILTDEEQRIILALRHGTAVHKLPYQDTRPPGKSEMTTYKAFKRRLGDKKGAG